MRGVTGRLGGMIGIGGGYADGWSEIGIAQCHRFGICGMIALHVERFPWRIEITRLRVRRRHAAHDILIVRRMQGVACKSSFRLLRFHPFRIELTLLLVLVILRPPGSYFRCGPTSFVRHCAADRIMGILLVSVNHIVRGSLPDHMITIPLCTAVIAISMFIPSIGIAHGLAIRIRVVEAVIPLFSLGRWRSGIARIIGELLGGPDLGKWDRRSSESFFWKRMGEAGWSRCAVSCAELNGRKLIQNQ